MSETVANSLFKLFSFFISKYITQNKKINIAFYFYV